MSFPDFMPDGAPIPKNVPLPYAEPNVPNFKPRGLPPGMSPLPKREVNPNSIPATRPALPNSPKPQPFPPPGRGVKGDNLRRRPLNKPVNAPLPRNAPTPIGPTVPQLIRKIIEYVLEPQPTSDGTIPDYDTEFPNDDATRNDEDVETICRDFCAPRHLNRLRSPNDNALFAYAVYSTPEADTATQPNENGETEGFIGYYKVWDTQYNPPPFESWIKVVFIQAGVTTVTDSIGRRIRYIKYAWRRQGLRRHSGKPFIGTWGYWTTGPLLPGIPQYDTFGSPTGLSAKPISEASGIIEIYRCGASYCPENDDTDETQDPNDYDRNEDDEAMACKWKPSNDINVEQLEIQQFSYEKFVECRTEGEFTDPFFEQRLFNAPKCVGDVLVTLLNDRARIEGKQCSAKNGSSYWNIKKGIQNTLYVGIPPLPSQEIALPLGCVGFAITFDAAAAKQDTTLRNLKRIGSTNGNEDTFINTMRVWLIDSEGNAISTEELWVPSTLIDIPFQYRNEICKIRMMSKSVIVPFTVFDTGDRWEVKAMPA